MNFTEEMINEDEKRWHARNVVKELGYCGDYMRDRKDMTNLNIRFYAYIMRKAACMLKEQEAVTPYIDIDEAKCPICKVKLTRQELIGDDVLFEDFFDYCPHCGRPVKWE